MFPLSHKTCSVDWEPCSALFFIFRKNARWLPDGGGPGRPGQHSALRGEGLRCWAGVALLNLKGPLWESTDPSAKNGIQERALGCLRVSWGAREPIGSCAQNVINSCPRFERAVQRFPQNCCCLQSRNSLAVPHAVTRDLGVPPPCRWQDNCKLSLPRPGGCLCAHGSPALCLLPCPQKGTSGLAASSGGTRAHKWGQSVSRRLLSVPRMTRSFRGFLL